MNAHTTINTPATSDQFADVMIMRGEVLASLMRAVDNADGRTPSRQQEGDRTNLIVLARDYAEETERLGRKGWAQPAGIPTAAQVRAQDFASAHRRYLDLRAASDAMPDDGAGGDVDASVDAYCAAMDALLQLPAPDHAGLVVKMDLIGERYEGSTVPADLWQSIRSEVERLASNG